MSTPRSLVLPLSSLLLVAAAGCRSAPPPTPVTAPVVAPAPTVATTVDAGAPAADPRRDALMAAWRATHPDVAGEVSVRGEIIDVPDPAAPGARVAAVLVHETALTLVLTPVPFVAGQQASTSLSMLNATEAFTSISARDVNGDQRPDLAVFLSAEEVVADYLPLQHFAHFFALRTEPERSLASMVRAEVQLFGVRDDAGLAAALPTLNAYEPPTAGMSPMRFLSRLRYATPAQFRAAVAPSGLRLCTDFPDRTGNRRQRCVNTPVARLTDALITGRVRNSLGEFTDIVVDDDSGLQTPSCQRHGAEIRCGASVGGPSGVNWSLIGEGATLRLIEISPWAEST